MQERACKGEHGAMQAETATACAGPPGKLMALMPAHAQLQQIGQHTLLQCTTAPRPCHGCCIMWNGVVPPVILHLQLLSPSAEPYLSLTDCHSSLA